MNAKSNDIRSEIIVIYYWKNQEVWSWWVHPSENYIKVGFNLIISKSFSHKVIELAYQYIILQAQRNCFKVEW